MRSKHTRSSTCMAEAYVREASVCTMFVCRYGSGRTTPVHPCGGSPNPVVIRMPATPLRADPSPESFNWFFGFKGFVLSRPSD